MIGANINIAADLAIAVGDLAKEHRDASVRIAYDDERAEQLWEVTFDYGTREVTYIVNDETGEARHNAWQDGARVPGARVYIVMWSDSDGWNAQAYETREAAERDFDQFDPDAVTIESTVQR